MATRMHDPGRRAGGFKNQAVPGFFMEKWLLSLDAHGFTAIGYLMLNRPSRHHALPVINTARCTGCGWCVAACPFKLLSLHPQGWQKKAVLHDADRCTGCKKCAEKCPFGVITMVVSAPPVTPS
jgi:NAD-dependent dihydropyrimidine dehydrogenase PreA subunit